ncbi:hypothetical protein [Desulfovibrio oxyclinae]|jgi:hypothetical protein|uniref:hypothetical protein n=1 Tax=Desulfovibrio oxyclinae TaxID=63560 RepID=UPI0003722D6C|nr:hypothetical protein [Desulfovibrio oxyclinae]
MGYYASSDDNISLEEQVKCLEDEELLDFWMETQELARHVENFGQNDSEVNPEYERVILRELQFRNSRKYAV